MWRGSTRSVRRWPPARCCYPGVRRSQLLAAAALVGRVKGGAGAVGGGGDEVTVNLVGDFDALVAKPPGNFGYRDALGQTGRGVEVAQ